MTGLLTYLCVLDIRVFDSMIRSFVPIDISLLRDRSHLFTFSTFFVAVCMYT